MSSGRNKKMKVGVFFSKIIVGTEPDEDGWWFRLEEAEAASGLSSIYARLHDNCPLSKANSAGSGRAAMHGVVNNVTVTCAAVGEMHKLKVSKFYTACIDLELLKQTRGKC